MKKNIFFIISCFLLLSCEAQKKDFNDVIAEMKINCFRADDSTLVSPVMLKIELINHLDSSFLQYYYCDTIESSQPYIFSNRNLQFGLYIVSAYWNEIEDYKIVDFKPHESYNINLYLKQATPTIEDWKEIKGDTIILNPQN